MTRTQPRHMSDASAATPSGPAQLIAKLSEHRQASGDQRQKLYGNISDDGLHRLLLLSYFVSQSASEGHYPRVRLFVPPAGELPPILKDPWQLAQFVEPVKLREIDDLRRLVPSAASHNLALEIHERPTSCGISELVCAGVCSAHSRQSATEIFSTSLWTRLVRPGLMIRIDGPGELRVSEGENAWHLQAGRLFELGGSAGQLPSWLEMASQWSTENQTANRLKSTIHFAWHEILHLVSEQRCGGCLVILPETQLTASQVEERYDIRLGSCTNGHRLGQETAEFVHFCSTIATSENGGEFSDLANRWLSELHRLLSHVDSLAQIAAVDGCTVFNADLQLIGFGGRIDVLHAATKKRFVDGSSGDVLDRDVLGRTGTRHVSAFRLCEAHSGVWCYVVSQDGQVTALRSDDLVVQRWVPYWPWANSSNQV